VSLSLVHYTVTYYTSLFFVPGNFTSSIFHNVQQRLL